MATKRKKTAYQRVKSHDWLKNRKMQGAYIVMRIDDYNTAPHSRGQFYPRLDRDDDKSKAIWPSYELAVSAARWAAKAFGNSYGVFRMGVIVEPATTPIVMTHVD